MEKYNLLPQQLIYEGTIESKQLHCPSIIKDDNILLTHNKDYLQKLNSLNLSQAEVRRTGFPLNLKLIEREKTIMQGTIDATIFALNDGIAFNVAGGTHHAFSDRGEGFCLLNDLAIAANYLLKNKLAKQILIVDLDVHQGNGTAHIFNSISSVFTFSMHGVKNYPLHKEKSDLDIELEDGTDDKTYLALLEYHLEAIIKMISPDFIFYQAGVDILNEDKLGRLAVSLAGCKQRDSFVLNLCKKNAIPIAITMGGGYAPHIKTIVEAHANTYRLARDMYY
jgi:acetoin utilization deacetylase AcuC-like enzyme